MPIVTSFDVTCGKDHMDIQIRFSGPFNGIVSSKGIFLITRNVFFEAFENICKKISINWQVILLLCYIILVGQYSDPNCIYVPPSSGKTFYAIRVPYARCGTKPDLNGQFYENTVCIVCMKHRYKICFRSMFHMRFILSNHPA